MAELAWIHELVKDPESTPRIKLRAAQTALAIDRANLKADIAKRRADERAAELALSMASASFACEPAPASAAGAGESDPSSGEHLTTRKRHHIRQQPPASDPSRPQTATQNATRALPGDADLAAVVGARPTLPDAVRADIVAIVKATMETGRR